MKNLLVGLLLLTGVSAVANDLDKNVCINHNFGDSLPNPIVTCTVMKKSKVKTKCYMGNLKIENIFKSTSDVYINDCSLSLFGAKTNLVSDKEIKIKYEKNGEVIEKNYTSDSDGYFRVIIKLKDQESHQIACVTQCASNEFFPIKF